MTRSPAHSITDRRDFVRLNREAVRCVRSSFILRCLPQSDDTGMPRTGFTVTKKLGNAVIRNRVRRRMREVMRLCGVPLLRPGYDYVLIGRHHTLSLTFSDMTNDLLFALAFVHRRLDRVA